MEDSSQRFELVGNLLKHLKSGLCAVASNVGNEDMWICLKIGTPQNGGFPLVAQ